MEIEAYLDLLLCYQSLKYDNFPLLLIVVEHFNAFLTSTMVLFMFHLLNIFIFMEIIIIIYNFDEYGEENISKI